MPTRQQAGVWFAPRERVQVTNAAVADGRERVGGQVETGFDQLNFHDEEHCPTDDDFGA